MYFFLRKHIRKRQGRALLDSLVKALVSSLATGLAAWLTYQGLSGLMSAESSRLAQLVQTFGAIAAGVLTYAIVIILLKEKEVRDFIQDKFVNS